MKKNNKLIYWLPFITTLIWKQAKAQGQETPNKYFITKDFLLTINLQDMFPSGNNLDYSIKATPPAKKAEISKKITAQITQKEEKPEIKFIRTIYPYVIGVNSIDDETPNIFTLEYDEEKKTYIQAEEFQIKVDNFTDVNAKARIYSFEIVSIEEKFYLDLQFCKNYTVDPEKKLKKLYCRDFLFFGNIGNLEATMNVSFEISQDYYQPERRTLSQVSISGFSDILFRDISTPQLATSLTIQALNISEIYTPNIKFKVIKSYQNKEFLTNMIVYGEDLIIGLKNKIQRMRLDENLNIIKLQEFDLTVSTGLAIQVKSHLDVLSMTGNEIVNVIRWDEIDSPVELVSMNFTQLEGKQTTIKGITSSYQFTIFRTQDQFIVKRFSSDDDYTRIPLTPTQDDFFDQNFNPDNTLIYTVKNNPSDYNFNVYNFSLISIASIVVEQKTEIEITATENFGRSNRVFGEKFNIVVIPDNTQVYNKLDVKTEQLYLSERLTSEFLFIKNIPTDWFIGNELIYSALCQTRKTEKPVLNKIFSVENLKNKLFNLREFNKSANNIFYYEFYSLPLSDGTFSMVIQIELTIYLQKCIVSKANRLKCKTWFKIEEEQMILEGILIKDEYFIYKITDGFKVFEFDGEGGLINNYKIPELANERSTCIYQILQKQDFLFCEDYEHRIFYIYSLSGGFQKILEMDDIYANQLGVSQRHQNYAFLNSDSVIQVISIRTKQVIAEIQSEITEQLDDRFKICGDVLMTLSIALNRYEEWNILDINNIVKIKEMNLDDLGYTLQKNTKLGYHFGCDKEIPLIVHDSEKVKALIIRLGEIKENSIRSVFDIGTVNYYANYFVEALDLRDKERPRIVWSHLDTSNEEVNVYGNEVSAFDQNQLVLDLTSIENENQDTTTEIDCNLRVYSDEPSKGISIDFEFTVLHNPIAITVNDPDAPNNSTDYNKTLKIDLFKPSSIVDLPNYFKGEVLNFNMNTTEDDYERSIVRYSLINNYGDLSKIMRCSREETIVKDIYIANSGSIYTLTEQAMFKIKNGTTYSVQNFMYLSSTGREGFICNRILLNEARNIIISLCEKSSIPYLVVSNWNSMKPASALSTQVVFNDIDNIQFSFIRDFEVYLFGKENGETGLQTTSVFVKYELTQLQDQIGINLVKKMEYNVKDYLELADMVIYTNNVTKEKQSIFIGIAGKLDTVSQAKFLILTESADMKSLETRYNQTFNFILNRKSEEFPETFSQIKNINCVVLDNKEIPEGNKMKFICVAIQSRNYHYEFQILLSNDDNFTVDLTAGYIAYGDFTSPGTLTVHPDYIVMATSEPEWKPSEEIGRETLNLPKSYALIYKRNATNLSNTVVNGIPLPFLNSSRLILKLVTLRGRDFVIISGSSYYSMVAIELKLNNSVEIFKDISTKNLTISAVNHYGEAQVHLELVDDTLKYFLMIIGVILIAIIVVFIFFVLFKKKEDKSKSTFDGFDAMQFADITDLLGDAIMGIEEEEGDEKVILESELVNTENKEIVEGDGEEEKEFEE